MEDFLKAFTDELRGLLPNRESEFQIELEVTMAPMHKAPYCMAPVELKDLKEPLEELFKK